MDWTTGMEMDYWTYRQIVIKAAMHYHILESVKSGLDYRNGLLDQTDL